MTTVVAFNGSPRAEGNTARLLREVLQELEKKGITTELVQVGGKTIRGCTACMKCFENRNGKCIFSDDLVNSCIEKMAAADGILLGSPVYFTNVTTEMKALVDRAGFVSMANGGLFKHKAGSAVVAVRRAGAVHTLDTLLHFMLISGMVVPGFPTIGMGRNMGDVEKDDEGMEWARETGRNLAWILNLMDTSKTSRKKGKKH